MRQQTEPTHEEILAAVHRIAASDMLRNSPRLVAFLRYIVEETLRGEGARIKSYAIGVEALGRDSDFDPHDDPIVRVEAGRLRRALEHYYAGPGARDEVVIGLPRGHYVPTFERHLAGASALFERARIARRSLRVNPLALCMLFSALAFLLLAVALTAAWYRWDQQTSRTVEAANDRALVSAFRAGDGFPVLSIGPFEAVNASGSTKAEIEALTRKFTDALARFDEIAVSVTAATSTIAGDPGAALRGAKDKSGSKYQLSMTAEPGGDGNTTLTFRLVDWGDDGLPDTSDDRVVWVRTFNEPQPGSEEDKIVRNVATILVRGFGIIHSRERAKPDHDPRYACVLKMFDYLQGQDVVEYVQTRACLERMTRLDPNFADGFAWLSWIYIREHQYEKSIDRGGPPALDRALKAAQRAVALKPQSARAHEALLGAYFARGEVATAFAEGDVALSLNPLDPSVHTVYGIRLIVTGQYDKGTAMLKEASADSVQRPTWLDAYLFLAAYLQGDLATASRHLNHASESYPLSLLIRALSAAKIGDRERVKRTIDRLNALYPAFRQHFRHELEKFIPSREIVERLAHDLVEANPEFGASN
jgi:adenylate cyclase